MEFLTDTIRGERPTTDGEQAVQRWIEPTPLTPEQAAAAEELVRLAIDKNEVRED